MITGSLTVVPGHAVRVNEPTNADPWAPENWILQGFQQGEVPFYREHAMHGVIEAVHNPDTLLAFSGGMTRPESLQSESFSYREASSHCGWWLPESLYDWRNEFLLNRVIVETSARDSFENLLFSLLSFNLINGAWPTTITVVGWEFKRMRFDLHRRALRIPDNAWRYEGVNNPFDLAGALKGEMKAIAAFAADPYGCTGALLAKREERNPHNEQIKYFDRALLPEIADFVDFCANNTEGIFPGKFPWEPRDLS